MFENSATEFLVTTGPRHNRHNDAAAAVNALAIIFFSAPPVLRHYYVTGTVVLRHVRAINVNNNYYFGACADSVYQALYSAHTN